MTEAVVYALERVCGATFAGDIDSICMRSTFVDVLKLVIRIKVDEVRSCTLRVPNRVVICRVLQASLEGLH